MAKQIVTEAARTLRLESHEIQVKTSDELEAGIRRAKERGAQALYVWPTGLTATFGRQISEFALANRLPSMHPFRDSAIAGGLLAYAWSFTALARRGAGYVDKVLRGANPGDLPVEQPTKFELVINVKTARALGLVIPPSILLRADEVIN
jgi:putative ABC transport system substrate-binding protein